MPVASELTILLIDASLRTAGAVVFGVIALNLTRSGRWRNPLQSHGWAQTGPTLLDITGVFIVYLASISVIRMYIQLDLAALRIPGSHAWHVGQCIDMASKLAACGLMIAILARFREPQTACGLPTPACDDRNASRETPTEDTATEAAKSWGCEYKPDAAKPGLLTISLGAVLVLFTISYAQLQAGYLMWKWIKPEAVPPVHDVLEAIENSAWGGWGIVHLTLAAVVFAPLAEELFFRGMLLQTLWRYLGHAWLSIVLSATAFGLIHYSQPQDVLPLVSMGIILGYVRMKHRSLTACVIIHALFNARSMLFVLLNPDLARSPW